LCAEFGDPAGGFFYTGKSHEPLIARQRDAMDQATPSGNAMAATALARLAALTGRDDLRETAEAALLSVGGVLEQYPTAAGQSLIALDFQLSPRREIAVVAGGDAQEFRAALKVIFGKFLPNKVVAPATGPPEKELTELVPLLRERPARDGRTTTYICEHFQCKAPVVGLDGLDDAF
jgi:hypothetical protein